jgi:hypothetical protein
MEKRRIGIKMNDSLDRKFSAALIVLFGLVTTLYFDYVRMWIKGNEIRHLPFPVKMTSCENINERYSSHANICVHHISYIWWGIIASALFWAIILAIAYKIWKIPKYS